VFLLLLSSSSLSYVSAGFLIGHQAVESAHKQVLINNNNNNIFIIIIMWLMISRLNELKISSQKYETANKQSMIPGEMLKH